MEVTESILALRAIVRITRRAKRFNFTLYQPSESVTLDTNHVMAGHRSGHLSPRVPIEMTGSVAGHDGVRQCFGPLVLLRELHVLRFPLG
jgi:hypothetical protein